MTFAAVAVGVAAAATVGTAVASSSAKSSANNKAGAAQAQAYDEQKAALAKGESTARNDLQPYANVGAGALQQLSNQMGITHDYSPPQVARAGETNDPLWKSILAKYNPQNVGPGTFFSSGAYQQAVNEYQTTKQQQAASDPNFGSLTQKFGMDQYKNDPGYTQMVTDPIKEINTLEELQATPGYKFRLEQGLQSANNSAAAKGSLLSGGQLKDLNNYAQGVASTEYQNAWQRNQSAYQSAWDRGQQAYNNAFSRFNTNQNNTFSRLQSMANNGQSAAGQQGNYSMSAANGQANAAQNNGQVQGNLAMAQGENQAQMYSDINGAVQSTVGYGMTPSSNGGGGWFQNTPSSGNVNGQVNTIDQFGANQNGRIIG